MPFLIAVLVVLVVAVAILFFYYNSFVSKRNLTEQAFSTIDVMLTKRSDLVPNLIATVKQYAKHESETLTKIAAMRSRAVDPSASSADRITANNEMGRLLSGLMVQIERYPDLKANTNFMHLQHSLNEIEEQLSAARRTFNATVNEYNTSIELFPGNVAAGMFGFRRKPLLEASEHARQNPDAAQLFKD